MGRTAAEAPGPVVQSHKYGLGRGADRDHRSCRPGVGWGGWGKGGGEEVVECRAEVALT